jgi:hypothetical protein
MFFNAVDWKLVVKDATVLAPFMLLALVMPPLIGVGIVAAAIVFRHPLQERALPRLNKFFARVVWNWPIKDGGKWPLPFYFRSFAIPRTLFGDPAFGASAFITAVLAFLLVQPSLYAGMEALQPIWRAALAEFAGYTAAGALFVLMMLLLAAWYASAPPAASERGSRPDRLLLALAALFVAFVLVYFVFTGYVLTGYSVRYLSLTVFFNDLLLALGLVAMIECVRGLHARFKQSISWRRIGYGGGAAVAVLGFAATVLYWSGLQAFLLRKLPPDGISFFPILSQPPFRGGTFAAYAYGGTVAYFTKNWAYVDGFSALAQGKVTLGPDGYNVKRESPYVWFADRATNPAYDKPEYFMTMMYQNLSPGYLIEDEAAPRPRVGNVPLIRAIREGRTSYLHPVEVARDPSPLDRWSIVRLDWDFPPFLRGLEGGEFVTLDASPAADGTWIRINYHYAHQEGLPEAGTRVTLFARSRCTGAMTVSRVSGGTREFTLPRSFAGTVLAEVQPATTTKTGPVYRSGSLKIGASADACREDSAAPK